MKKKRNRTGKHHTKYGRTLTGTGSRLSLCMIVKNEAENIAPCINSLKPVLDEIIVVDTGSTDKTKEMAKEFGAKVFDFQWCDDFSAARNESIRHATGDYILWLDADDRVDPSEVEKIRSLKKLFPTRKNNAYYVVVNNQSPVDGETRFFQMRIFPRVEGVRFDGRIHEQIFQTLVKRGIQLIQTDIVIRHTGYSDSKVMFKKSERNLHIVEEELKLDSENPLLHYNAARTLSGMNRQAEAISHMKRITENENIKRNERSLYMEASLLLGKYYVELEKYDEALSIFKELSIHFERNSLVHFCLGETLFLVGDFERAQEELSKSIASPIEVSLFPVNLDRLQYYQYFRLGQCYLETGKVDSAREMFLKSLHRHKDHYKSLEALGLLSLRDQKFKEAIEHYEMAIKEGGGSDQSYANLGLAHWKMGSWVEAERALNKALEINPKRIEALTNLGHLYHMEKEYSKAMDCFMKALNLNPDLKDIRIALSEIYFRQYDLENLVEQCDALLRDLNLPRNMTINSFWDLGLLYRKMGETFSENGAKGLSLMAYHLSLMVYPSQEILDQIISMAQGLNVLENSKKKIQEVLEFHGPLTPALSPQVRGIG
jgi:glycosyltransferase involved in cell wall biosynthesis